MELVKTNQLVALRHAPAELHQRVDRALHLIQLAVHLAHELVEMQSRLAPNGHGIEEAIHQKALSKEFKMLFQTRFQIAELES